MKLQLILATTLLLTSASVYKAHAADPAAGKAKYDMLCASCHGASGAGDGVAAAALNPKPRNLQVTTRTDEELKKVIKEGGASMGMSSSMPAMGAMLADADIENIVAYIRTLKK